MGRKKKRAATAGRACLLLVFLPLAACGLRTDTAASADIWSLEDGQYTVEVTLEGGSGKAAVSSPALLTVEDGDYTAEIEWSSPYYDYMILDGETYLPVNESGNSVFELPVTAFDEPVDVIADTTAMSTPHEIEYTLTFDSASVTPAEESGDAEDSAVQEEEEAAEDALDQEETEYSTDISADLTYTESMELFYAEEFSVDYYSGGFALITIADTDRYLVVPEGSAAPEDLEEDIIVLAQPLDNLYLAASAVMDMILSIDALDSVRFSGTKAESWYLEEAAAAMEAGELLYAGKYSAPDYEMILSGGCTLAVENTMIYHTPEVKEQLESLGIPVLVDYSSYESEPLGRTEWVKLYGLLLGKEEEASAAFSAQLMAFQEIEDAEDTGFTVAFFYITSSGEVNVRRSTDYLAKMIEMAGGEYISFDDGDGESTSSTLTIQMEEFYAAARDADYLIYNSTVDGELTTVEELLGKSELLANFAAVETGNVFCTTQSLYQSSMELGDFILDIYDLLHGEEEDLTYLYRLE